MPLDFGLSLLAVDQLFIRYRQETPGFVLTKNSRTTIAVIDRLLLHIDFPAAERDDVQRTTGILARGTGILQFSTNRPPYIISRDVERANSAKDIGFVLDVSSPYQINFNDNEGIPSITPHIFASSFVGAKEAFNSAYQQYAKVTCEKYLGIPVFDVYGWATAHISDSIVHKPRMQLCGFTESLTTPLGVEEQGKVNELRKERMEQYKLYRPRIDVQRVA